nr:DNA binding protein [uncultured phage]
MEKFIKIYYSLLHSDLAHSSQLIYSFLLYAYEMNNKLKIIKPLSYSVAELSKELEYSENTIKNGLSELEKKGYIIIDRKKGEKNVFFLTEEKYNDIINT